MPKDITNEEALRLKVLEAARPHAEVQKTEALADAIIEVLAPILKRLDLRVKALEVSDIQTKASVRRSTRDIAGLRSNTRGPHPRG